MNMTLKIIPAGAWVCHDYCQSGRRPCTKLCKEANMQSDDDDELPSMPRPDLLAKIITWAMGLLFAVFLIAVVGALVSMGLDLQTMINHMRAR